MSALVITLRDRSAITKEELQRVVIVVRPVVMRRLKALAKQWNMTVEEAAAGIVDVKLSPRRRR